MADMEDKFATSVIIVNYRTMELTLAAVKSALQEPEVREVVVIDNASGDGSVDFLRRSVSESIVRVHAASANLGFARASNLAAAQVTCPLILLLNSDATLVAGAVGELARALVGHQEVGVVAPAVYESDGMTLQADAYGVFPEAFPRPFKRTPSAGSTRSPDWVSGVAMMFRREDFLAIGGFDERFRMYLEDVDICRRLHRQGRPTLREPAAAVNHLGGQSWTSSVRKTESYQRSKMHYFRKDHLGVAGIALLHVLRVLRISSVRVNCFLSKRKLA